MSIKSINGIKIFVVILTLLITSALLQVSAEQKSASNKWLTLKVWRGSFTIDRKVSKSTSFMGVSEEIDLIETTTGSVVFNDRYTEEGSATWSGPVSATTTITATRVLSFGTVTMTEKISGNGSSNDINEYGEAGSLMIDINDKKYDVGFSGGNPEIKWKREMDGATKSAVNKIEVTPVRAYFMALLKGLDKGNFSTGLTSGVGFLPGNQKELTDISTWFKSAKEEQGHLLPSKPGSLEGSDIYDRHGTFIKTTWSLSPSNIVKPVYYVTVENLSEFKSMEPEPGKRVRIRVYTKDKNPVALPIQLSLEDVSEEPGECLNKENSVEGSADIRFDTSSASAEVMEISKNVIRTKEPVSRFTMELEIRDYGAFGKLKVETVMDDIRETVNTDYNGKPVLHLPYDENENKIVDSWEKDHRIYGKNLNGDWDRETKPELNGKAGDGLTLYEEYRGVFAREEHTRLRPGVKELLVEYQDEDRKQKILQGLNLFQRASGIRVVEMKKGELKDRVANYYSKEFKKGTQHGVILRLADLGGTISGETNPIDKEKKTPKDVTSIEIGNLLLSDWDNLTEAYKADTTQRQWNDNVKVTVAHELAHSVKGDHHGDKEIGTRMIFSNNLVKEASGELVSYTLENGARNPRFPDKSPDPTGRPQGQSSGDVHCIMCYNHFYKMIFYAEGRLEVYQYTPQASYISQHRFCTSPVGTGHNGGGKWHGDADRSRNRGDCIHKFQVRDYPLK